MGFPHQIAAAHRAKTECLGSVPDQVQLSLTRVGNSISLAQVMTFEAGAAEMPPIRAVFLTFPGVAKPQMCSLFVVGQMRGEFQKSEEL